MKSLTVYQRTAQWIAPNPLYYQAVGDGVAWALKYLPFYDRWYRTLVAYPVTDGARAATRIDPDWDGGDESVSEINALSREFFLSTYAEHVHDAELLAQFTPTTRASASARCKTTARGSARSSATTSNSSATGSKKSPRTASEPSTATNDRPTSSSTPPASSCRA